MTWVGEATRSGAKVQHGGKADGLVIQPTLLTDTTPDMNVEREEIFGPVVLVKPYDTFEGAVDSVNATDYGLQAGIFTRDVSRALGAFGEVHVGGLMINDVPIFRVDNMPFGGLKLSGVGKEGTRYAIESMTELRLLVLT
jgi:acyl-CoA reductase-like NAD-dependent aldehyde dehydrogenase